MSKGFTIIEILVVIAVFAIVGTIMVVIFTNTLRGSNKSQILGIIKQNGQSVLENMDKKIRNADNLLCPSESSNTIVVERSGIYTRYRIVPLTTGENGYIIEDHPTKQMDQTTGQLETDSVFILSVCNPNDPMPRVGSADTANILTDTNTQSGVSIEGGSFAVSKPAGFKAAVTVNFVLKPGIGAPSATAGQIDPVAFKTTIELR